jgi:hypothetical protein
MRYILDKPYHPSRGEQYSAEAGSANISLRSSDVLNNAAPVVDFYFEGA